MIRPSAARLAFTTLLILAGPAPAAPDEPRPRAPEKPKADAHPGPGKPVSFLRDVAPILVRDCIACHNARKSEGKYAMTTFAQLLKGSKSGDGDAIVPGKPDDSNFIDVLLPDAEPRMPYKLDPLATADIELLRKWIAEGAKYDGSSPGEDWAFVLHKTRAVTVPESYPAAVPVTALAFSPDGARIATSGYHEMIFWNVADGTIARRVAGLPERTQTIAISPDGKRLATAGGDPGQYGIVRLWDVEAAGGLRPARDLAEGSDVVFAAAFSPDGKALATAGADRVVRVYEVESGKPLVQSEDHADWIFDVAFSPDGKQLATASRDKTAKVLQVATKESLATFPGHTVPVYAAAFLPDGKTVVSAGEDNAIRAWTVGDEAKQVRQFGGFGGAVFRLRLSPDGKTLAACSADKTVRTFKADTGAPLQTLKGHADWVYSVAFSPDGKTLASGSWDGEVRLWNLADGKPVRTILAAPGFKRAK
ncbi:translocation protein TolB [Aquisphaera giovannonii]|uniref:Translocation protein TolB n=1 Tax=Aquisphaera giovannonii TaxID=406548 RepID=A0A5B9WC00_9BACT|nr:c-type cytochrome domain-containing protein [Aquisphaera giovannonii]QEH37555.1 translocation protein TolB [Aquisphaera giovannonii]